MSAVASIQTNSTNNGSSLSHGTPVVEVDKNFSVQTEMSQDPSNNNTTKIAIVGMSGRFPESESVTELMSKLDNGEDLITSDDRRWPAGVFGIPERHGQLKDIKSIDASFFRIHGAQAEKMDPQLRLLLSCTYEALNDAGLNPSALRGSRTGVFIGACFSDCHDYSLRDSTKVTGYENTGCAHSMFANRLSYAFDWNGPSFVVDTACSSSMVAFAQACTSLERGECDVAVVGGVSISLRPEVNLAFKKLGMLSPDGSCKSFDTEANGYCRSECVGVVVLTRLMNQNDNSTNNQRILLNNKKNTIITQNTDYTKTSSECLNKQQQPALSVSVSSSTQNNKLNNINTNLSNFVQQPISDSSPTITKDQNSVIPTSTSTLSSSPIQDIDNKKDGNNVETKNSNNSNLNISNTSLGQTSTECGELSVNKLDVSTSNDSPYITQEGCDVEFMNIKNNNNNSIKNTLYHPTNLKRSNDSTVVTSNVTQKDPLAAYRIVLAPIAATSSVNGGALVGRTNKVEKLLVRPAYAYVSAWGVNNDGLTTKGITFPSVEAQRTLNSEVLARSGFSRDDIGYIEAHGTGTVAGDGTELRALDDVYGVGRTSPLLLGSIKSNMGHAEGAAGIASLIKMIASFERNQLPPNIHFKNPNTNTTDALKVGRFKVPTNEPVSLAHVRAAAVSSFGFGGTNAHVILEKNLMHQGNGLAVPVSKTQSCSTMMRMNTVSETAYSDTLTVTSPASIGDRTSMQNYPEVEQSNNNHAQHDHVSIIGDQCVVPVLPDWLSARLGPLVYSRTFAGTEALTEKCMTEEFAAVSENGSQQPLVFGAPLMNEDLSWIQNTFPGRGSSVNGKVEVAVIDNSTWADNSSATDSSAVSDSSRPVWLVFTGNGGIWCGMGAELYVTSEVFKNTIDRADEIAKSLGATRVRSIIVTPGDSDEGKIISRDCTSAEAMISQVALQIGLVRILRDQLGIRVSGFAGHSAGEIAAAYADNTITLETAVLIAFHRNDVIDRAKLPEGHMYAAGLSREAADKVIEEAGLKGKVVVGCHNDPSGVTLSGQGDLIDPLAKKLVESNVFCRAVPTKNVAHHSPMLEPLFDELVTLLRKVIPEPKQRSQFWETTCCVPSRSDRDQEIVRTASADYFAWNFIQPVEWVTALSKIPKGAVAIEVGPHALLASPTKRSRPDLLYMSCMKKDSNACDSIAQMYAALWRSGALDETLISVMQRDGVSGSHCPASLRVRNQRLRSALVQWDHSVDFGLPSFADVDSANKSGNSIEIVMNLGDNTHPDAKLLDHIIDGRCLIPAAAYVCACWRALVEATPELHAPGSQSKFDEFPIELEDFIIHQATQVDRKHIPEKITFQATVAPYSSGLRTVALVNEEGELIASCKARLLIAETDGKKLTSELNETKTLVEESVKLAGVSDALMVSGSSPNVVTSNAFYTAIRARGYEYGPHFRAVEKIECLHGGQSAVLSFDEWPSYIDGLLQSLISPSPDNRGPEVTPSLSVPTQMAKIVIRPDLLKQDTEIVASSESERDDVVSKVVSSNSKVGVNTVVAIESWNGSASSRWASVKGLEMKPLKRAVKEHAHVSLSKELPVPLFGIVPVARTAVSNQNASKILVETALELASHTMAQYELAVCEIVTNETSNVTHTIASNCMVTNHAVLLPVEFGVSEDTVRSLAARPVSSVVSHSVAESPSKDAVEVIKNSDVIVVDNTVAHSTVDGAEIFKKSVVDILKVAEVNNVAFVVVVDKIDNKQNSFIEKLANPVKLDFLTRAKVVSQFEIENLMRATVVQLQTPAFSVSDESLMTFIPSPHAVFTSDASTFDAWHSRVLSISPSHVGVLVGSVESGVLGLFRTLRKESKTNLRLMLLDNEPQIEKFADAQGEVINKDDLSNQTIMQNLMMHDSSPILLSNGRTIMHVAHCEPVSSSVSGLPAVSSVSSDVNLGYYLKFERDGDLTSANWLPGERRAESDEVYVDVHSSALNFKDVMLAYGKIDPSAFYGRVPPRSVGFELAGVLRDANETGRRVMGFADNALATVAVTKPELLWDIPDHWSFNEAATVPVAYSTAYYALFVRGGGLVENKTSVLIHAGAGAVGQAALQICLNRKCKHVFVSCSESKREFLMRTFGPLGLQEDHIVCSRSVSFERHIMRMTNGRGVDLVLNSLSEDKLKASLRVVAQHGHFLEIGKYDIMEHSQIDMHLLVKNISIHGIDVDQVRFYPYQWSQIHQLVQTGIQTGEVKPLASLTAFSPNQITDMFRFMGEGKHTGKVILDLQTKNEDNQMVSSDLGSKTRFILPSSSSTEEKAHLIIGGFGGFGLALAFWLAERGARKIVLASRSGVSKGEHSIALNTMKTRFPETEFVTENVDFTSKDQCVGLTNRIGSIGSVFNLAMVLNDCMFDSLDGQKWLNAVNPKVKSMDNILSSIAASKSTSNALERVVSFSSVAAGLGNTGQANYAFANSYLDSLTRNEAKNSSMFPNCQFLSVQWGTIGDVGVAARQLEKGFLEEVMTPQPLVSCFKVLDSILASSSNSNSTYMSYLPAIRVAEEESNAGSRGSALDMVLAILRIPANSVREQSTLESLGMDSMQSVEVQSTLRRCSASGKNIPVAKLLTMTIADLQEFK